ncbi:glutathione S-transferase, putative [Pediculus humanus corporis]|uniref:glutathione transferase n=1 Tax=Pediculus humanus subsp. corporis TaxID=121224 RepID=E0VL93_PEDHC|nr:glutathione S-transferase, putative [Pediculus humanus corporis]EEB14149.1 glutathione S-transferase, putative [Pediculus humanus corporis]
MNPEYKLIYFNARGRAEHIRFIFAYAGVDYVDERISQGDWPEYKKKMPFGTVPVLEVNGKTIAQSNAIARYLAKKYNLAGKNDWESLECDVLIDSLSDIKQVLMQYRNECDPLKKEEKKIILMKETIPFYMNKFEDIISKNNGFSVGESVTWADFVFASSLENFECIFGKNALDRYPALKALKEKIFNIPKIKEWVQKRPQTDF